MQQSAAASRLLSNGLLVKRTHASLQRALVGRTCQDVLKLIPILKSASILCNEDANGNRPKKNLVQGKPKTGERNIGVKPNRTSASGSSRGSSGFTHLSAYHGAAPNLSMTHHGAAPNVAMTQPVEGFAGRHQNYNKGLQDNMSTACAPAYMLNSEDTRTHEENRPFESDLVVVLDIDECLVHSQFTSNKSATTFRQFEADRPENDPDVPFSSGCENFSFNLPDGDTVHVNKRPNLDKFIEFVSSRFETHIFTAAMEIYARPVLDRLDPQGSQFQCRFYRESCSLDPKMNCYVKNLSTILNGKYQQTSAPAMNKRVLRKASMFNECRVVLVDNNPLCFLANPNNGILVSSFYDDPSDDTLPAVIDLLTELDKVKDVRPALQHLFGLEDALKDVLKYDYR